MLDRQDSWVYVKVELVAVEMGAVAVAATTTMDMDIMVKANLLHRPMYVETEKEHLMLTAKTWLIKVQGDGNAVNVIGVQSGGGGGNDDSHNDGSDNGGNAGQTGQLGVRQSGTSSSGDGAAAVAATTTMDMDIMVKANLLHRPMYVETEKEHLMLTAKTWLIKYREMVMQLT